MKKGILIIGAGGVSRVATVKWAMNIDTFEKITLASRTLKRCDSIAMDIKERLGVEIETAQVDADDIPQLVSLIKEVNPKLVLNVALPYQDLTIMDACTEVGVDYV
ncbi:saccharopine dehydrogenase NADP-binding domain-containing protein, partial [Aliarcobacter skirrowii]